MQAYGSNPSYIRVGLLLKPLRQAISDAELNSFLLLIIVRGTAFNRVEFGPACLCFQSMNHIKPTQVNLYKMGLF